MKKILLLVIGLVMSVGIAQAQSIKENKIDKFTKMQRLQTSYVKIGGTGHGVLRVGLRAANGNEYLRLKWQTEMGSTYHSCRIGEGYNVIFLDDQGETYKFYVVKYTSPTYGGGATGIWGAATYGLDIFTEGDWRSLQGKVLTDFRIITTEGYLDVKLSDSFSEKLTELCEIFDEALIK